MSLSHTPLLVFLACVKGGSSQLTDLLGGAAVGKIVKHTFDIQGDASIDASIREGLVRVARNGKQPITVLFVEVCC